MRHGAYENGRGPGGTLLAFLACAGSLAGCTVAREEAMSNRELLQAIRARTADLRTRLSYAERRADALKTKVKASWRIAEDIRSELRSAGFKVGPRGAAIVVGVAGTLLFPSGEIALRDDAKEDLDRVAAELTARLSERPVLVEGHTDASRPWRTAEEFATNWELSAARALAVARYLIESGGVSPGRVSVAAYGDTHPVASNETKEGRARNRRVEIVLPPPIGTTRVTARIE